MTNDNITVAIDRLSDDKKNTAYPLNVCDSAFWDDIALVCKQARLAQMYKKTLMLVAQRITGVEERIAEVVAREGQIDKIQAGQNSRTEKSVINFDTTAIERLKWRAEHPATHAPEEQLFCADITIVCELAQLTVAAQMDLAQNNAQRFRESMYAVEFRATRYRTALLQIQSAISDTGLIKSAAWLYEVIKEALRDD